MTMEDLGKYKPYPAYKESGVEWLGEVPEHWEVKRLKYVADLYLSNVDKHTVTGQKAVSLCNYVDVYKNDRITSEIDFMQASASNEQIKRLAVVKGDVIITKDSEDPSDIGVPALVAETIPELICGYHLAIIRPKKSAGGFLNYLFKSNFVRSVFNVEATGMTRYALGKYSIENLMFATPPKEEQSIIAFFIDRETAKIDKLIVKHEQLIEVLQEKRSALISHAVTKGLNPDAPMKDSGIEWLGEVPEHWKIAKLFHLTKKIGDGLHGTPQYTDDSNYYFINGNNLVDGRIFIADTTKRVDQVEFEKYKVELGGGSLLMSINGTIGNVALYNGENVVLGKSAAYINCSNKLHREFLYYFLKSVCVKLYFNLEVSGTTIFNLSLESIRNLFAVLPSHSEQSAIVAFLDRETAKIDNLISKAKRSIELLQEHRSSLISAAVTGKIDVRNLVKHPNPQEESYACNPPNP